MNALAPQPGGGTALPDGTDPVPRVAGVDPEADARAAAAVGALARLYLRHGDAPRALALGLAAIRLAPPEPGLVLVAAAAFLQTGDPEQARAALERMGRSDAMARPPRPVEEAGAAVLTAKALNREGDRAAARDALARARRILNENEGPRS